MGLGVLEDTKLDHVPGTVLLNDHAAHTEDITGALKHGQGRDAEIVLSPQPSEDPNDPLNWSTWKKESIIWILCLGAMLHAGVNGPFLNASYFEISALLGRPLPTVVLASGYNLLAAGCSGPFVCAFSRKYGKRHVFLISSLFDIIGTAIGESNVSFKYLLVARVVQGFSTSAYESLIIAAVGDLYFVHQRGLRVAIINFILNAASSLASIICGQVFQSLGYLWLFHLFQIFCVLQFVLVFLFCPETTYIRDERYNTDTILDEKYVELAHIEGGKSEVSEQLGRVRTTDVPRKKTFVQELALFSGVYSRDSLFKFLVGPFLTLLNPAACYAVITSGLLNSWYVGGAIILSGIFSGPPWMFNAAQIGYLGAGPVSKTLRRNPVVLPKKLTLDLQFIGGMLGSTLVAVGSDPIIKLMTKRNNGT
ncbi:hypothetical protein LTS16_012508 [Friedmanniomyces endolithicus]|nr:hypothetical protein LTR03_007245 [Friedmanniomyces endolithicus]KAK0977007.1 hypothetical protein LTS01_013270 [Friedmanniomyces endolithicus]KAK1037891.1 hypothetical protein LTS16_012508 [Friedmanniomyces endolithicus]